MTLNDLEGHSPVAGLFKCSPSNICTVAFYQISTDCVLTRSLSDSWASYSNMLYKGCTPQYEGLDVPPQILQVDVSSPIHLHLNGY